MKKCQIPQNMKTLFSVSEITQEQLSYLFSICSLQGTVSCAHLMTELYNKIIAKEHRDHEAWDIYLNKCFENNISFHDVKQSIHMYIEHDTVPVFQRHALEQNYADKQDIQTCKNQFMLLSTWFGIDKTSDSHIFRCFSYQFFNSIMLGLDDYEDQIMMAFSIFEFIGIPFNSLKGWMELLRCGIPLMNSIYFRKKNTLKNILKMVKYYDKKFSTKPILQQQKKSLPVLPFSKEELTWYLENPDRHDIRGQFNIPKQEDTITFFEKNYKFPQLSNSQEQIHPFVKSKDDKQKPNQDKILSTLNSSRQVRSFLKSEDDKQKLIEKKMLLSSKSTTLTKLSNTTSKTIESFIKEQVESNKLILNDPELIPPILLLLRGIKKSITINKWDKFVRSFNYYSRKALGQKLKGRKPTHPLQIIKSNELYFVVNRHILVPNLLLVGTLFIPKLVFFLNSKLK